MLYDDLCAYLAFCRLGFITPTRLKRLKKAFSNLRDVFSASLSALQALGTLSLEQAQFIRAFNFAQIEPDLRWLEGKGHYLLSIDDENYPTLLKKISSAPILLYAAGKLETLALPAFAVVGSRKPSPLAEENAYYFSKSMAKCGFSIVSGLAQGIDTASHRGALVGGTTVAVMGTGMNLIYPRQSQKLAQEIEEQGLLLSEFPLDTKPHPNNFPRRNRIISGLAVGVLVVEAALKSGSLITARYAIEQGREIFAIPGSIHNPQSRGCHWLIRQGAILTENLEDIIEELQSLLTWLKIQSVEEKLDFSDLDEDDRIILRCLGEEPIAIDQIVQYSQLPLEKVAMQLLKLELNNLILSTQGGYTRVGKSFKNEREKHNE